LEEGKQKFTEMRKHLMELLGSKNIDHSSSGRLQIRSSSSPLLVYCKEKKKKKEKRSVSNGQP
jgi:hypothetical protein